ncbi:uncharacterized protein LOC132554735 [Ylistrum balloti]|uniref:uncharacterized protein LOC132554735 n=1 Tax=Ylistrum balloti TaxID=509963 RepID=UPI002905AD16|nr:uncharacterized protein LOC132554735 [Ylistrum balloti]
MGTPHWVSMFDDPRKYPDSPFVSDACLSSIQESRCGEWVQDVRRISKESLMSRPLPDIPKTSPVLSRHRNISPVTSYDNKCYHDNPKEIHRMKSTDDTNKRRRSKRHTNDTSSRRETKNDLRETSVTLTLSVKNGSKKHRYRDEYVGMNNVNHSEVSTVLNHKPGSGDSFSRKESENSGTELVSQLSRKKRRRNVCIVPMLIMTVLIIGGLFTAIAVVFMRPLEEETETNESGYEMVIASVQLRLLNKTFNKEMRHRNTKKYAEIEEPLCHEMDGLFLFSEYSGSYYGCKVQMLRSGSIHVLEELIFRETQELRKPSSIQGLIKTSSPSFDWKGVRVINVGDFVVDYESIKVQIDTQHFQELPKRPLLSVAKVFNDVSSTTTFTPLSTKRILESPKLWKWGRTTVATTTTRKSAAKPTTMTSAFVPSRRQNPTTKAQNPARGKTTQPDKFEPSTLSTTTSTTMETPPTEASLSPVTSQYPVTTDPFTSTTERCNDLNVSAETQFEEEGFSTTMHMPSSSGGPSISMSNAGSPIAGGSVVVQCVHQNLAGWTHLTVTHEGKGSGIIRVLNVSSDGRPDPPDGKYTDRLIVQLKISETSASVSLNFTKIDCTDEGSYVCSAYSPKRTLTERGYLYIRASPTKPEVTMPLEIVDQREIKKPIKCTANVGYPVGTLKWSVKPHGQPEFIPLDVSNIKYSGECKNIATSVFKLIPAMAGNGTILKCEIVNQYFPKAKQLSTSRIWKVIPAGLCLGKLDNHKTRHPYRCDHYISCTNNTVHVVKCKNNLCFNTETNTCGESGIVMKDVVAYMNEGVTSLMCRVQHLGNWDAIRIRKILPSGDRVPVVVASNETNVTIQDPNMQGRLFADIQTTKYEANLKLWIYTLQCADAGIYVCEVDTDYDLPESQAQLSLKVKPKPPQISSPIEIIEGKRLRQTFSCQGEVGYPNGDLRWEVKYKDQIKFSKVSSTVFNDTQTKSIMGNCSKTIRRELSFIPSKQQDQMVLRCVVQNDDTLPEGQTLWDSFTVHVIPANFCSSVNSTYLIHPHNCRQYIQCAQGYVYVRQCSIGLCFNPDTQQCDIPEPIESTVFDPEFPCRPNKNGVYYPHAFLCNKYTWCVQGKGILQHCPLGTLYLADGQCTFNTEQSLCYNKDQDL